MNKINFENYPSTNTPVSADNLNLLQTNVENGISDVVSDLESTSSSGHFTLAGKIGVEWGTVTVPISGSSTFLGEQAITFVNNYAKTPSISAVFYVKYNNDLEVYVISRSATGCTIGCHTSSSSTATRIIAYRVVGELAEESEGE